MRIERKLRNQLHDAKTFWRLHWTQRSSWPGHKEQPVPSTETCSMVKAFRSTFTSARPS